jgi:hypothetical protein
MKFARRKLVLGLPAWFAVKAQLPEETELEDPLDNKGQLTKEDLRLLVEAGL